MSKLCIVVVMAVAACLIPAAMSASCPSWKLNNLETQIEICSRGVPVQMYEGSWQWARYVTRRMGRETTCNLDNAPGYFQGILEGRGYIGKSDIERAVNCVKNSISSGICC